MDPFEFEESYHSISLAGTDPQLMGTIDITAYASGWGARQPEFNAVMSVVAVKIGAKGPSVVPEDFEIGGAKFHVGCIHRAYEGRASPEEFSDAVHLAFLTGRFKQPVSARAYAKQWFGIDCNAYVGNYCGISPSTSIAAYAHGYPDGAMSGATPDLYVSRGLLPLPPIANVDDIDCGTVLLTFGDADTRGNRWRHIALVQSCETISKTASQAVVNLSICEWGSQGGSTAHQVPATRVTVDLTFKCPELPGKTCIAYPGKSPDGSAAMRIFLDGSRFDNFDVRGRFVYDSAGKQNFSK